MRKHVHGQNLCTRGYFIHPFSYEVNLYRESSEKNNNFITLKAL